MNANIQKVLEAFAKQPYRATMGAKVQAKRLKVSENDIKEAKKLYYSNYKHPKDAKILILDIETSPMKAWVWKRWREDIYLDQTISEWFMLSWSAKWLGSSTTFGYALTPKEVSIEEDFRILKELHKVLDEADIVIAHNGSKFDIPKINTRFILHGMVPTLPYKQIDTLEVAKKQFGFSSNSLDALATFFNIKNKDLHDFNLWKSCMDGDKEALSRLLKYNKNDVEILEKIYLELRPWIKNHPNINVIVDTNKAVCTHCGSSKVSVIKGGAYNTQHYKYPVLRCENCGAIFKSKEKISSRKNYASI